MLGFVEYQKIAFMASRPKNIDIVVNLLKLLVVGARNTFCVS